MKLFAHIRFGKTISLIAVLSVALMLTHISCSWYYKSNKPNIVLVLTDNLRRGDMCIYENDILATPFLDSLLMNSIRFKTYNETVTSTALSEALLTGKNMLPEVNFDQNNNSEPQNSSKTTIAQIFRNNDYKTGFFGNLKSFSKLGSEPNNVGFDTFFGFTATNSENRFDLKHNLKNLQTNGYFTDVTANAAIQFMVENYNEPFLCYMPLNLTADLLNTPNEFSNKYKRIGCNTENANYYGNAENIDNNLKRVFQTLDSLKIINNTIVIIMSASELTNFTGSIENKLEIENSNHNLQITTCLHYPKMFTENTLVNVIAKPADMLPTLLDICKILQNKELQLDGISLIPFILNNKKTETENSNSIKKQMMFYSEILNVMAVKNTGNINDLLCFADYNFPKKIKNN